MKISFLKNIFKIGQLLVFVLIAVSCSTKSDMITDNWNSINQILDRIDPPNFLSNELNVLDFGAVSDSTVDSKFAIQNAIDSISKIGGGTVKVPQGIYLCAGSLFLKSNVNLHLEDDVRIIFSTNPTDYLPVVLSRWEGIECYNYSALIYAKDQENIALTGNGILDGDASSNNWWPWKGKEEYGFETGMPSQLDSLNRPRLLKMNNNQTSFEERIFGDDHYLRPNLLQLINCRNILIENITFKDSPMWFIHPVLSENITIRGVTVVGKGPNNDGLDPESCKDVLIENCIFDTGDDCIAIKSGRNGDGRRINKPSENIIIRNCQMIDGHGGVVIGSEISGGCKNVFVENCKMDSPNLDRAIRIKTNTIRGGVVENIFVRNVEIGEVKEAVLRINLKYEPNEIGERNFPPTVKNIYLDSIQSNKSMYAFYIDGLEESKVSNVFITNSKLNGVQNNNILNNVEKIKSVNLILNGEPFSVENSIK